MENNDSEQLVEKREWVPPTVEVLDVASSTKGIPFGNAFNDGVYS